MAHWLRHRAPKAGSAGSIPGWGSRSHRRQPRVHMPQVQISPATGQIRDPECSQINIFLKDLSEFSLLCTTNARVSRHGAGGVGWREQAGPNPGSAPTLLCGCCQVPFLLWARVSSASRTKAPEGTSRERSQGHRGTRQARSPRCRRGRSRDRSEGATIPPRVGGTGSAH